MLLSSSSRKTGSFRLCNYMIASVSVYYVTSLHPWLGGATWIFVALMLAIIFIFDMHMWADSHFLPHDLMCTTRTFALLMFLAWPLNWHVNICCRPSCRDVLISLLFYYVYSFRLSDSLWLLQGGKCKYSVCRCDSALCLAWEGDSSTRKSDDYKRSQQKDCNVYFMRCVSRRRLFHIALQSPSKVWYTYRVIYQSVSKQEILLFHWTEASFGLQVFQAVFCTGSGNKTHNSQESRKKTQKLVLVGGTYKMHITRAFKAKCSRSPATICTLIAAC